MQTRDWGIAVLKAQANLPDALPGQNVTFLLFGDTTVDNPSPDMHAVTVSTRIGTTNCADVPELRRADPVAAGLAGGDEHQRRGRDARLDRLHHRQQETGHGPSPFSKARAYLARSASRKVVSAGREGRYSARRRGWACSQRRALEPQPFDLDAIQLRSDQPAGSPDHDSAADCAGQASPDTATTSHRAAGRWRQPARRARDWTYRYVIQRGDYLSTSRSG